MWLSMTLFTMGTVGVTIQQFTYWMSKGMQREAWVFLGWMAFAWAIGLALLGGLEIPAPTKPIFPDW